MRVLNLLIILIVLIVSACSPKQEPEESCNFVQNSKVQRVSWKGRLPIPIYIHWSVPEVHRAAIFRAMAEWEVAAGRQLFRVAGVKPAGEAGQDGESVIYWQKEWEEERSNEQARTTLYWVGDRIEEADIKINDSEVSNFKFDSGPNDLVAGEAVDLESLLVHELGHVLGLKHNQGTGSVMAETLKNGDPRRVPSHEDLASIACEYSL